MTLTAGDMAAITGMMTTLTTVSGIIVRYFVKSEITREVNKLRLELSQERVTTLEHRVLESTKA